MLPYFSNPDFTTDYWGSEAYLCTVFLIIQYNMITNVRYIIHGYMYGIGRHQILGSMVFGEFLDRCMWSPTIEVVVNVMLTHFDSACCSLSCRLTWWRSLFSLEKAARTDRSSLHFIADFVYSRVVNEVMITTTFASKRWITSKGLPAISITHDIKQMAGRSFGWTYIENTITPPKFNIAPQKWWLEDYFPTGKVTFQGLC